MKLSKWHGLGNDYLLVERDELAAPLTPEQVRRICDYHFGVGSDGILEVVSADGDQAELVIWNPDGSTAELSGNGTRIAARWLARRSGAGEVRIVVGPREVVATMRDGAEVEMDMGAVEVGETETIRVERRGRRADTRLGREPARGHSPRARPRRAPAPRPARRDARALPGAHQRPARPRGRDTRSRRRRLGARRGETLSSGTSAVAASAAAVANGWCESPVTVHLAGGNLRSSSLGGRARLTGPAEEICLVELSRSSRREVRAAPGRRASVPVRRARAQAHGEAARGRGRDQPRDRRSRPRRRRSRWWRR